MLSQVVLTALMGAEPAEFNYDEGKVRPYTLPDPLTTAAGVPVTTPEAWTNRRRAELLELFRQHVYGRSPGLPPFRQVTLDSLSRQALDGQAVRKQVTIRLSPAADGPALHLLLYLPASAAAPVPVFLGLNFQGNQAITPDPEVTLSQAWMRERTDGTVEGNRATEKSRGTDAAAWPVPRILARGYGLATAYYGDIDPDFDDGFRNGVHALFPTAQRAADDWGTIGAWAWGLSRILDYLEADPDVDARRVAVLGHSRLGKTALWAGAQDERFALVISNDSGCGGAALSRRWFGETVKRINTSFPHWFCANFQRYNDNEAALPVDQHELLALVAPRPVYVASAQEDAWADPRGEFLSCVHADPVYRLLGTEGLPAHDMPPVHQPLSGRIGYHIRTGKHAVTDYDWDRFMDFADRHLGRPGAAR